MVQRSPLVIVNGRLSELPPGDSIDGAVTGIVTAGSGLVGGGDLNTGSKRLDVALEANASGLIYVGDSIGYDGVAETTAAEALASGLAGLSDSVEALASGNEALEFSQEALVSGNAALAAAVNSTSFTNSVTLTAASDLSPGTRVGLNAIGEVEAVVEISGSSTALKANSPSVFANATIDYLVTDYSTKSGKGLIVYEETVPLYARTIEVVGDQAVLSERITLSSGALAGLYPSVAYSEIDDKFLTIFRDAGAGTFLSSRAVMISGDSLFAGPARTAGDAAVENTALAYHPTLNGFIGHSEQTSVDDTTGFYILNSFSAASN